MGNSEAVNTSEEKKRKEKKREDKERARRYREDEVEGRIFFFFFLVFYRFFIGSTHRCDGDERKRKFESVGNKGKDDDEHGSGGKDRSNGGKKISVYVTAFSKTRLQNGKDMHTTQDDFGQCLGYPCQSSSACCRYVWLLPLSPSLSTGRKHNRRCW